MSEAPRAPGAPQGRRRRSQEESVACYAALDLGTNNCRLLVATPTPRGFRVVASAGEVELSERAEGDDFVATGCIARRWVGPEPALRERLYREAHAVTAMINEARRHGLRPQRRLRSPSPGAGGPRRPG